MGLPAVVNACNACDSDRDGERWELLLLLLLVMLSEVRRIFPRFCPSIYIDRHDTALQEKPSTEAIDSAIKRAARPRPIRKFFLFDIVRSSAARIGHVPNAVVAMAEADEELLCRSQPSPMNGTLTRRSYVASLGYSPGHAFSRDLFYQMMVRLRMPGDVEDCPFVWYCIISLLIGEVSPAAQSFLLLTHIAASLGPCHYYLLILCRQEGQEPKVICLLHSSPLKLVHEASGSRSIGMNIRLITTSIFAAMIYAVVHQ